MEMENGVRCFYEGAKANASTMNGWGNEYFRVECENGTAVLDRREVKVLTSDMWEKPTEEMMQQLKKKSLEELARSYLNETLRLGYSLEDALEELKRIQTTGVQTGIETQEPEKL
jgi:hypothetical protein